jgi:hypothetical protein
MSHPSGLLSENSDRHLPANGLAFRSYIALAEKK